MRQHLGQQAAPLGCGQPARPLVASGAGQVLLVELAVSRDLALLVHGLPPIHHLQQHQPRAAPTGCPTPPTGSHWKLKRASSELTKVVTLPEQLSHRCRLVANSHFPAFFPGKAGLFTSRHLLTLLCVTSAPQPPCHLVTLSKEPPCHLCHHLLEASAQRDNSPLNLSHL